MQLLDDNRAQILERRKRGVKRDQRRIVFHRAHRVDIQIGIDGISAFAAHRTALPAQPALGVRKRINHRETEGPACAFH
jgi:hypothetical protein